MIDRIPEIQDKIDEIKSLVQDNKCIFRGEPKHHPKITCGLYRRYGEIEAFFPVNANMPPGLVIETPLEIPTIAKVSVEDVLGKEKELLKSISQRLSDRRNFDRLNNLAILQHVGYGTSLLDFTLNYEIAMFFACQHSFDNDGRIIIFHDNTKYTWHHIGENDELDIAYPRAQIQESVLVECPKLYLENGDYKICTIPKALKFDILRYLDNKGISREKIFPDFLGVVEIEQLSMKAMDKYHLGVRSMWQFDQSSKRDFLDQAIQHLNKAIDLKYDFADVYKIRGKVFAKMGDLDSAKLDFNKALVLDPDDKPLTVYHWFSIAASGSVHKMLSQIYKLEGKDEKAEEYARKSDEIKSRREKIKYNKTRKRNRKRNK